MQSSVGCGRDSVNYNIFAEIILSEVCYIKIQVLANTQDSDILQANYTSFSQEISFYLQKDQSIIYILYHTDAPLGPLCVCQIQILVIRLTRADHLHRQSCLLYIHFSHPHDWMSAYIIGNMERL